MFDRGQLYTGDRFMLGIQDKWVSLAYILCVVSTLLCVIYGLLYWNKGDDSIHPEDRHWAKEEDKVEDKL
jgi:hypothetical protein